MHLQRDDVADRAVVDALHRLALAVVVAPAEAGDDRQVLLLRLAARLQDRADAGGVDGDRLLAEDVLAGLDGRLEVQRPEVRRRGQEHHVDAAGDHLLVGVEADEAAVGRDVDLGRRSSASFWSVLEAVLEPVLEGVAHRDELDVRVGVQGLRGRAGAAAAAADEADAQGVAAGGVDQRRGTQRDGAGRGGGQELAAQGAGKGNASRESPWSRGGGRRDLFYTTRRARFH